MLNTNSLLFLFFSQPVIIVLVTICTVCHKLIFIWTMSKKSLVKCHTFFFLKRDGQCCFLFATKPKILGILLNQLVKPIINTGNLELLQSHLLMHSKLFLCLCRFNIVGQVLLSIICPGVSSSSKSTRRSSLSWKWYNLLWTLNWFGYLFICSGLSQQV